MEKIIHYCWFGEGEKPKLTQKCIETWKKFLPDYKMKKTSTSIAAALLKRLMRRAILHLSATMRVQRLFMKTAEFILTQTLRFLKALTVF